MGSRFPRGKVNTVARIKNRIVEPSDSPSDESEAISLFFRAGWPTEDARWLGPLCLSVVRAESEDGPSLDHVTEHNLQQIAGAWNGSDPRHSRNRALLIAYARLCGCGGKNSRLARRVPSQGSDSLPKRPPLGPLEWSKIAAAFREHGASFESALVTGGWPGDYDTHSELRSALIEFVRGDILSWDEAPEIVQLMHLLVDGAGVAPATVVDREAMVAIGSRRSIVDPAAPLRVPEQINRITLPPIADVRSLTNWMIGLGPRALTLFFPEFRKCPSDRYLAALAVGIQDVIEHWMMCRTHHWTHFHQAGPELGAACEPFLQELGRRCAAAGVEVEPQLRRSWLWFAWCVYESDPDRWQGLPPERREVYLRAANEDLARVRLLLARAKLKQPAPALSGEGSGHLMPGQVRAPWEEFEWERGHFDTCVMLLHRLGGIWRGMKPLLLAIRSFACPCVAKDLRYWPEQVPNDRPTLPDDLAQPPEPWAVIPGSMINLFHAFVGKEQAGDPDLTELRGELSQFCLERLADRWSKVERANAEQTGRKRSNEDMLERSPEWRLCLIRAAASLHINPEAKGHRMLHAASRIDPDEEVREAARAAYEQLRRFKGLPENLSPRRAVMSALWWIRQAHLLGLEIQPDPDGAQRTRAKELTRTKEAERADKPATRK